MAAPISQGQVKLIQSLSKKRYRQKYNKFIVEGTKIALELLNNNLSIIDHVYATEHWLIEHQEKFSQGELKVSILTEHELKILSQLETPQGVLIVVNINPANVNHSIINNGHHFFLDAIQDPGNLGTILRVADWFGIRSVILGRGCVDIYNPKVIQSSMGSLFRIPVLEMAFSQILIEFPTSNVYATTLQGQSLWQSNIETNAIIIFGNEGNGIDPSILSHCTYHINIPRSPTSDAESLNVAISAGIIASYLAKY